MTIAICVKCGARKHGAWSPCDACGHSPFGVDEVTWSIVLTDHYLRPDKLDAVSAHIVGTGTMPAIDAASWEDSRETVRKSARHLRKYGLLPPG